VYCLAIDSLSTLYAMADKITSLLLIFASIALFFFTIAGKQGVVQLTEMEEELKVLQKKNRKIQADINNVNNEIFAIKNNNDVLEEKSRAHLGLSKPDEIVYIIK